MTRAILAELANRTSSPTPEYVRASVREAAARLDAIAADLGELMAEMTFAPLDRLEADHRRFRERFSIGRNI